MCLPNPRARAPEAPGRSLRDAAHGDIGGRLGGNQDTQSSIHTQNILRITVSDCSFAPFFYFKRDFDNSGERPCCHLCHPPPKFTLQHPPVPASGVCLLACADEPFTLLPPPPIRPVSYQRATCQVQADAMNTQALFKKAGGAKPAKAAPAKKGAAPAKPAPKSSGGKKGGAFGVGKELGLDKWWVAGHSGAEACTNGDRPSLQSNTAANCISVGFGSAK